MFAAVVIAVAAGWAMIGVRHFADDRRQALVYFHSIIQEVSVQNALEWQSIAEHQVSKKALRELHEAQRLTEQFMAKLQQTPVTWKGLGIAYKALDRYQNAVDKEFALISAGQLKMAEKLHETEVDPSFVQVSQSFDIVAEPYQRGAEQAGLAADIGSIVILLIVVVIFGVLIRRFDRVEQTVQLLETKQTESDQDTLTGLLNRVGFNRHLAKLVSGQAYTLAMIDVNDLKRLNDQLGHGAGDTFLKEVAQKLQDQMPLGSLIARWGGDEFVLLVPENKSITQELLSGIALSIKGANPQRAAFSYGLAQIVSGESLDRAVAIADAQMYDSKSASTIHATGEWPLTTLEEFSAQLERFHTPDDVIELGISMLRRLLGFDASDYLERQSPNATHADTDDETFTIRHIGGNMPASTRTVLEQSYYRAGVGIAGRAIQQNSSAWSNDYANDSDALEAWVKLGVKSYIVAPVSVAGQLEGLIGLFNFGTWRPITPQVRALTEAVALRLGHALERVHSLQDVQRSLEGGFFALGVALEARDFETSGHTERVVKLAEAMGQKFGLDRSAFEALKHGAFLHDIGKLSVPDKILLKPGKLDATEWAMMKTHAQKGFEIASRIPTLNRGALEVVRSHHERWDGTGYPDNLAGTRIPLLARIFAICDVYDALVSERNYKHAWTQEQALSEIGFQSGKHFDPAVVQAFMEVISQEGEVLASPISWQQSNLKAIA